MKIEINLFNEEFKTHQVNSSSVSVGRSSQCDVVINHESMSRKHCLIEVENGKIFITDLGSTNGVSIDGNRIPAKERTFYLNSLPLMIGAATVTIDLTDHQTQMINLAELNGEMANSKSKNSTGSFKTEPHHPAHQKSNPTLILETKSTPKGKVIPKKSKVNDEEKKRQILMVLIVILALVCMGAWYITQS